jgi:protein phosphatase 2C
MEDASAVVPWFIDAPVRLHTSRRDLDDLGLNADYYRERLQVLLRQELRLLSKDLT